MASRYLFNPTFSIHRALARIAGLLAVALLATACGGGGGGGSGPVAEPPDAAPAPPPPPEPAMGRLRPVTGPEELEQSLKQGLLASHLGAGAVPVILTPEAGEDELGASVDFSRTNLQEVGVDEADSVKYDGEILYIHRPPAFGPQPLVGLPEAATLVDQEPQSPEPARIRLLRTAPDTLGAVPVGEITLEETNQSVSGMYLREADRKQLVLVGESRDPLPWQTFEIAYYWIDARSRVEIHDVSDPAAPRRQWLLEWDGAPLGSRRIGQYLYLLSRYSPTLPELVPFPSTEVEAEANRDLLESVELQALLPALTVNGESRPLLEASDCLVPNPEEGGDEALVPQPEATLTVVTAIDLENPGAPVSRCYNGSANGFYLGRESLYITAGYPQGGTELHKFALDGNSVEYRGSGRVPGYLGTGNPAFLMSERDGVLRVVSSLLPGPPEQPPSALGEHRLSLLQEATDAPALALVAQLPNESRPEPIGKPGERVFAVRYLGDRAYVVTFELIDPLYVIDLADPGDPRISGELEIPGFSTLLQPLGEGLLLGVGSEVDPAGPALPGGVKVALFDVSDTSAPIALGTQIIGRRGSYSAALSDHHALTVLSDGDGHRVALPVVRHASERPGEDPAEDPWYYWNWTDTALYLFHVDSAGGLVERGRILAEEASVEQPWPVTDAYRDRSVLHGDTVYYIHGAAVWSSDWNNPDALLGPN